MDVREADPGVRHQLPVQPYRGLIILVLLQLRIGQRVGSAARADVVPACRTEIDGSRHVVATGVGTCIGNVRELGHLAWTAPSVPGRDFGIGVVGRREIGPHRIPEDSEERLERCLAVPRHIPIHAGTRDDIRPRQNVSTLEPLLAAELSRRFRLVGVEVVVALPPDAVGQRHPSA